MSLFRLDASIRVEGSHSREIADIVELATGIAYREQVIRMHVGQAPRLTPTRTRARPRRPAAAKASS